MNNQLLQAGTTTPTVYVKALTTSTGAPLTTLTNATAGLTLAYLRPGTATTAITLVSQTAAGAYTSGGFVHVADGMYRLDAPVAAAATGAAQFGIVATALPADVTLVTTWIGLSPDPLTVASPTDSTIATAVDAALADNFAAIPAAVAAPSASAIAAAVWAASTRELTGISASIREAFADTLLGRTISGLSNGGRTVTSALRMIRNRIVRSGSTITYYQEDDATTAHTAAITSDSTAAPITSVDPA